MADESDDYADDPEDAEVSPSETAQLSMKLKITKPVEVEAADVAVHMFIEDKFISKTEVTKLLADVGVVDFEAVFDLQTKSSSQTFVLHLVEDGQDKPLATGEFKLDALTESKPTPVTLTDETFVIILEKQSSKAHVSINLDE